MRRPEWSLARIMQSTTTDSQSVGPPTFGAVERASQRRRWRVPALRSIQTSTMIDPRVSFDTRVDGRRATMQKPTKLIQGGAHGDRAVGQGTEADRRVLAGSQLPIGRPDLSL